ncbi:MAG: hypothetical protein WC683_09775 [bacterium]
MYSPRDTEMTIDEVTYKLRLDLNAQCLFEEKSGKNFYEVMNDPDYVATSTEDRLLFWCMLRKHHPEITLEQAGELMVATSSVIEKMAETIRASQPKGGAEGEAGEPTPTGPTG